jgi:putative endopeptidase
MRGDKLVAALLLIMLLTGCQIKMKKINNHSLDLKNIDALVKPGSDFYHYAVGKWLKKNPIPKEYSSWGSFSILSEENLHRLKEIMEKAEKGQGAGNKGQGKIDKLVGDFYATGMDEKKIETDGIKPLKPELDKIEAIKDTTGLVKGIAHLHRGAAGPLFSFGVGADPADSDLNIAQLFQGGLNLPDRDYYLKDDDATKKIRATYVTHVKNVFQLLGETKQQAESDAATILKIETALAKVSSSKVELRDPKKNYNPMGLKKLAGLSAKFNWALYFSELGLKSPGKLNVGQPAFFKGVSGLVGRFILPEWKTYLRFCLINENAGYLNSAFVNENFDFYGKTLNGAQKLMPRWKRVVGTVSGDLDQAVGQLYAKEYFPPQAKARAVEMVENIRAIFRARIKGLDWMSAETKQRALKKLSAMTLKIGYPDKWKDYSALTLQRDSYILNALRVSEFEFQRDIKKVGKPVDRTEWYMSPQTVNASYDPSKNDITFPAGILQPPFFNAAADNAVNYGGIGSVIAHEMTHGFDDEGGKYDARGNLKDWWTAADAAKFKRKAQGLVDQFGGYELFKGLPLNGELTLGENIADLGGITLSFNALEKVLAKNDPGQIDGLTPEQRFFLSYAQVWRNNTRDERAKLLIKVDPHSPAMYRVNGPLSNLAEFYSAFGLVSGEAMYKAEKQRVKIW